MATENDDDLSGTPGDDILAGLGGNDLFRLQQGGDDLADGGTGDDRFYFGGALNAADIVIGGAGVDRILLQGQYSDLELAAASLSSVEAILLLPYFDSRFGGASAIPSSYRITIVDANVAAGAMLVVNGLHLQPDEPVIFDGSAETDGTLFVRSGSGTDSLTGGAGDDSLFGLDGDDVIDAGAGADLMIGGPGDDLFYVDDSGDVVIESGGGFDTVFTRANFTARADAGRIEIIAAGNGLAPGQGLALQGNQYDETIIGGSGDDILAGGGDNDVLIGNDGIDQLDGGDGIDVMNGGAGDDIYFVGHERDIVQEEPGGGFDTIYTNGSYTLRPDVEVEVVAAQGLYPNQSIFLIGNGFAQSLTSGAGNDVLEGGGGDDFLTANDGSDHLDGGTGADAMAGGNGDDIYFADNPDDLVHESVGGGFDAVYASGDVVLRTGAEVEMLAANAVAPGQAVSLTGNEFGQSVTGASGNDVLLGGGGDDFVIGHDGDDLIDGGAGLDAMGGGAGADIFRFLAASDSDAGDILYDFVSGTDRIDLAAIDANTAIAGDQAFAFIGTGAFTNVAGQLRIEFGERVVHIFADVNGDGAADLHILAYNAPTISAADFFL